MHIPLWLLRVTTLQLELIRLCCRHNGSGLSLANLRLQYLAQGSGCTDATDPFQGQKGGSAAQPGLSKSTHTQPQCPPQKSCQQAVYHRGHKHIKQCDRNNKQVHGIAATHTGMHTVRTQPKHSYHTVEKLAGRGSRSLVLGSTPPLLS